MSEKIFFQQSTTSVFQIYITLDGQPYIARMFNNMFGLRWYIHIYNMNQELVLATPLIESPDDTDISLTKGHFDSSIVYRASSGNIEIMP